jgi:hypothetical protein
MRETVMATKDFVVFDSDSHVVEPPALWLAVEEVGQRPAAVLATRLG